MLRRLIVSFAVSGALVRASTGTTYSFKTVSGCSTASASTGTVPMSLPTSSTSSTVSTIITNAEVTVPSTSKVTADPVTTTLLTQTAYTYIVTTTTIATSTSWQGAESIVATATWPTTICTNGVTPSVVTEYSGVYTPTPGQVTKLPTPFPSQVLCTTGITWYTYLLPTATSGLTIVTVTPTSTVNAPTTTSTVTYSYTSTAFGTTVTSVTTSFRLGTSIATVSTACEATTTTTYAAKCAPTNVIAGIGDHGLVSGKYAANNTVIYIPNPKYYDPSACCQLCQDNEGCSALYAGFAGACGLLYVNGPNGGPVCDFTFSYQTQSNVFPGQGLWVQSGCGEIDYTGPDGV
ncbi:hypothetical protein F4821DRAFT_164982 [Hypoxylon rubiginosum]|uniref:Uncharacterized protein n=1 Tax=Hypoxylon rubiginosum TaxID=110542 RepID=A0ACC0CWJ4_9PEZI|nr:hypothetical protein F4821DRAFT_164982 [Hypoxylon rubiginosum]